MLFRSILASGGSITDASATLTLTTPNIIALSGNSGISGSSVTLAFGANTAAILNPAALTISSAITATAGLSKSCAGTLTLNYAHTYTGTTTINAGTLTYGSDNVIFTDNVAINNAILDLNGFSDTIGALAMAGGTISTGAGTLTLGGDVTGLACGNTATISGNLDLGTATRIFDLSHGGVTYDMVISAVISSASGAYGITKDDGQGVLVLSGNNTYTGVTTALYTSSGIIYIQHASALGSADGGTIINSSLHLAGGITVAAEALTLNGTGLYGDGALRSLSGNNAWGGPITLTTNSSIGVDTGNLTVSGVISGDYTLTKALAGTLTLSGNNTYTGLTTVGTGVLNIQHSSALGTTAGATTVSSGAALQIQGGITFGAESLTLSGTGISSNGALRSLSGNNTWQGAITLGANTVIAVDAGDLAAGGIISGSFALTKIGEGSLTLNARNTYTGTTSIDAGTVYYGVNNAVNSSSPVTVAGGTLDIAAHFGTVAAVTLTSGTISGTTGVLSGSSYTVSSGTISAILGNNSATLTKNTPGTVFITNACTYTGATTLNAGTLTFKDTGSALNSTFTVNYGAILTLDNSSANNTDRLSDSSALTMNGASFNFIGSPATSASENIGALTLNSGLNTVTITPGAGGATTVIFASLSRTASSGATSLFRGTNFGLSPAANVSTLMFNTAPTLTGAGGAANSATISIIKGAIGDSSLTGLGTDMVTYNTGNTNGIRLLNGAGFSGEYAADLSTTNANVRLTQAAQVTARTINSLILASGGSITDASAVLTIGSASNAANLIALSGNSGFSGANATLAFGAVEGCLFTHGNLSISSLITWTGGLTKSGSTGTLTLSYANTYTGTTIINSGTLAYATNNAISSGAVTLINAALSLAGYSDTIGALTMTGGNVTTGAGTLTLGGNVTGNTDANSAAISGNLDLGSATRTFTIGNGDAVNDMVVSAVISSASGAYGVTKAGTGTLVLSAANTYTGLTTVSAGVLNVRNATALGTTAGATSVTSGAALQIQGGITIGAEALTLNGSGVSSSGGALRNISGNNAWQGAITLANNSRINSDADTLDISGDVNSGAFILTAGGTGNAVISGVISGSGALTKDGNGTLILSGANNYPGVTTVSAGILNIRNNTACGTTGGGVTVSGGAELQMQGGITVGNETLNLTFYGISSGGSLRNISGNNTWQGTVSLDFASRINSDSGTLAISGNIINTSTDRNLTIGGAGNITVSGIIGINTGTLTKDGAGTLTLSGANTYSGTTTLSYGTIVYGTNNAIGSGAVTINNGTFDIGAYTDTVGTFTLANGTVTGTTGVLTSSATYVIQRGTISAILGGNVGLTKSTKGTVIVTSANTYTGVTTISDGVLSVSSLANGSAASNIGASTSAAGNLVVGSGAILRYTGGALTFDRLFTVNSGIGNFVFSGTGDIIFNGAGTISDADSIKVTSANNVTIGSIIGGSGAVTKAGSGTLTLTGANTYTGATTVYGGALNIQHNTALGTTASGVTVHHSGSLQVQGGITVGAESLILYGSWSAPNDGMLRNISGNNNWQGVISLAGNNARINSDSGTLVLSGAFSGSSSLIVGGAGNTAISGSIGIGTGALTKDGAGTLTLSAANTYTGATTVNAGILRYGISNAISSGDVAVSGATFDLNGYSDTIGALTMTAGAVTTAAGTLTLGGNVTANASTNSATISGNLALGASRTFTIADGAATEDMNISAVISGASYGITKAGAGALVLSGANTYSGATTVNAGTLSLKDSGTCLNSAFTVNSGATLTLDNSGANNASRLANATALTLNGGSFNFIGSPSAAASETAGALTLNSGANTVTITPAAGGSTTMTFASLSRSAGATVLFRGTDFGLNPAANVSTLMFTSSPTLTGAGGAANSTTISIIKGAFGDNSLSGTGTDMVTYNTGNTNGLRLLNGAGFSGEYAADFSTTNANVRLTSATVATARTINSLILASGSSVTDASATLDFTAGNLIVLTGSSNISGSNAVLAFGATEGCLLNPADLTISSNLTGTAGLTKSGAGILTLSYASGYTGATTVNAGTLRYGISNAISSVDVAVLGATFDLNGYSDTIGALTMTGGAVTTAAGTLTLGGNVTTNASANSATISGNLDFGSATRTFTIADGTAADDMSISAVISSASGAYGITKAGSGTMVLSAANTYTGTVTVNAGVLNIQHAAALGATDGATSVTSGAALQLQGFITVGAEALTLNGSGISSNGALRNVSGNNTWQGNVTLGAVAPTLTCDSGTNLTISGIISGSTTLTKNGTGTLILSGANNYTGATTVSAGALNIRHSSALGTIDGATTVSSGAALQLQGNITVGAETLSLAGTGVSSTGALRNISGNNVWQGAVALSTTPSIASDAGSLTISGIISGSTTLTKNGTGTLILSGANSYTGATTVSAGVLNIQNATATGTTAGGVTVSSGATLQLQGGITVGAEALTLNGAGINNDGALRNISGDNTWQGNLTLASASRIN